MSDKCKICQSSSTEHLRLYNIEMIKCKSCGIHYLAEFGSSADISEYYKTDYRITSSDLIDSEFRRIFRLPEQLALISEIMEYVPTHSRLLDIGCDKAYFIDEARRYGYACTGIELSETSHRYAHKAGIILKNQISDSEGRFECCVMWHSLEHIPEPISLLSELKLYLSPGAYLFIRVPAFDSFWRRVLGRKWIWLQPQNHFYHYSAQSLRYLLSNNGFEVISIEHRKPNTRLTKRMYRLAKSIFKNNIDYKIPFRRRLIRFYEDLTGVELFAVAKLRD